MNDTDKTILDNRAHLQTTSSTNECDGCDEPLIFRLRDQHHEFSLNMQTVLECLKFAEEKGAVPKIDEVRWDKIKSYHGYR